MKAKGGSTIAGFEALHRGNNTTANALSEVDGVAFNTLFSNTAPGQSSWSHAINGIDHPLGATWGVVKNYRNSTSTSLNGVQEFTSWQGGSRFFTRSVENDVWTAWGEKLMLFDGDLIVSTLPIFQTNAQAILNGLKIGTFYRTAKGNLKVVH